MGQQQARVGCRTAPRFRGSSSGLRRDASLRHLPLQLFIDQTFMGRVLIHDHHARRPRLRHDIGPVKLRPRRAQRIDAARRPGCLLAAASARTDGAAVSGKAGRGLKGRSRRRIGPVHLVGPGRGRVRAGSRRDVALATVVEVLCPRLRQRVADARHDQPAHETRIPKPEPGFWRGVGRSRPPASDRNPRRPRTAGCRSRGRVSA